MEVGSTVRDYKSLTVWLGTEKLGNVVVEQGLKYLKVPVALEDKV